MKDANGTPEQEDDGVQAVMQPGGGPGIDSFHLMVTAGEAYPELERCFLGAKKEIRAGFRIFDPQTRLRSTEGQEIGETWVDLIEHTLRRGVTIDLVLCDFDPIAAAEWHRGTWRSVRGILAAAELSGAAHRLRLWPARHSAQLGWLPRLVVYPKAIAMLKERVATIRDAAPEIRRCMLRDMPGLRVCIRETAKDLRAKAAPPTLWPASHHQKLAVFDRKLLYIGGLDLDERRYDTPEHDRAASLTWHDLQILVRGQVAEEAHGHLGRFLREVAGEEPPAATKYLLRTLSVRRKFQLPFLSPRPVIRDLRDAHLKAIARAEKLIYLETQFFRDRKIARALVRAAKRAPGLRLVMVLPAAPEDVAFDGNDGPDARFGEYLQARCIGKVREAFGKRALFLCPVQPRSAPEGERDVYRNAPLIYVHAKLSVFDDREAILSSANLNGRSMNWDTEAGIRLAEPDAIRSVRERCFRHWLPKRPEAELLDPDGLPETWRALAEKNASLEPAERRGFLLPYSAGPARRFGRALPGMPEEMV